MRLSVRVLTITLLAFLTFMPPAHAGEFTGGQRGEIVAILRDALKQDPSILREAIVSLQADDAEREKLSTKAALAAAGDSLVRPGDPVGGNPKGNVTIVEFFDVRCPYCRKLEPAMASLLTSDPNVRLVYKDLPILGPASLIGSKAILAAAKQNAYEKFRAAVMHMPSEITRTAIETEAKKMGLDSARLLHDMDDASIQDQIDVNLKLAHQLNIQGTPAMIVGGELLPGAVDIAELKRAVSEARLAAK